MARRVPFVEPDFGPGKTAVHRHAARQVEGGAAEVAPGRCGPVDTLCDPDLIAGRCLAQGVLQVGVGVGPRLAVARARGVRLHVEDAGDVGLDGGAVVVGIGIRRGAGDDRRVGEALHLSHTGDGDHAALAGLQVLHGPDAAGRVTGVGDERAAAADDDLRDVTGENVGDHDPTGRAGTGEREGVGDGAAGRHRLGGEHRLGDGKIGRQTGGAHVPFQGLGHDAPPWTLAVEGRVVEDAGAPAVKRAFRQPAHGLLQRDAGRA